MSMLFVVSVQKEIILKEVRFVSFIFVELTYLNKSRNLCDSGIIMYSTLYAIYTTGHNNFNIVSAMSLRQVRWPKEFNDIEFPPKI